ncbi:senescence-specific cysteine protease SAG39-like [Triticum aestivum]|uniref:senescence-specific cysteine protease SAG39-like n=1 Tax=Triticum aestivum TaxID=4565 RepID=UPI001D011FEA|nr:senescence-specific cysteine protease SAG39-like [Triticum aestivum]
MFRPPFGAVGRTLARRWLCSSPLRPRLRYLHSQRNSWDTAGRRFSRDRRTYVMVMPACCVGLGLWYMKKIEERAAEKSARPSKIDWVEAGVVSPVVRNQKGCGCCWAMAAVASVEAVHNLKTSQSISLSVQELIDCNFNILNRGCQHGTSLLALWYIQKDGLSSESSYPYMARMSMSGCKKRKKPAARISGFRLVYWTEDALEKAVAKQPVIVRLQGTTDLLNYKGGIMDYETLPEETKRHAVLIVGYGTDPDGVKYWRFKNSWGEGWGEGGFGRIRRHVADKRGVLGIFMKPGLYPVLNI